MEADPREIAAYIVVFCVVHFVIVKINTRFSSSICDNGTRDIAKFVNIAVCQFHERAVIDSACSSIDSVDRVRELVPRRHYIVCEVYLDYLLTALS